MSPKEFYKMQCEKTHWRDDEILPPPTKAQDGLGILIKHFLGDDWYCISTNNEQGNTEAIYEILEKYPHPKHISLEEKIRRRIDKWKKKKQC